MTIKEQFRQLHSWILRFKGSRTLDPQKDKNEERNEKNGYFDEKKKASREDRTPDLSLTKRVLYRLSY